MFVVDTSCVMAWCFEDEATEATEAVLDRLRTDRAAVPSVWPLEVANVLLVAARRGRLTEAQTQHFLDLLDQLPVDVEDALRRPDDAVNVGRVHQLSAYDASYLLLAERSGAPLATPDRNLSAAAVRAGVELII